MQQTGLSPQPKSVGSLPCSKSGSFGNSGLGGLGWAPGSTSTLLHPCPVLPPPNGLRQQEGGPEVAERSSCSTRRHVSLSGYALGVPGLTLRQPGRVSRRPPDPDRRAQPPGSRKQKKKGALTSKLRLQSIHIYKNSYLIIFLLFSFQTAESCSSSCFPH